MNTSISSLVVRCVGTGLICAAVFLNSGCRERGSSLTHEEAISAPDSAAVANQATAPQGGPQDLSSARTADTLGRPEPAGVQHGFADSSGGHSLPRQAEPAAPAESEGARQPTTPTQPTE